MRGSVVVVAVNGTTMKQLMGLVCVCVCVCVLYDVGDAIKRIQFAIRPHMRPNVWNKCLKANIQVNRV